MCKEISRNDTVLSSGGSEKGNGGSGYSYCPRFLVNGNREEKVRLNELCLDKTGLRGFRLGSTQTWLCKHREKSWINSVKTILKYLGAEDFS